MSQANAIECPVCKQKTLPTFPDPLATAVRCASCQAVVARDGTVEGEVPHRYANAMEKLRLKIVSDGNARMTKVLDVATGMEILNVRSVTWKLDSSMRTADATIELVAVPVEIESMFERVGSEPPLAKDEAHAHSDT